jgi:hypothetical protein
MDRELCRDLASTFRTVTKSAPPMYSSVFSFRYDATAKKMVQGLLLPFSSNPKSFTERMALAGVSGQLETNRRQPSAMAAIEVFLDTVGNEKDREAGGKLLSELCVSRGISFEDSRTLFLPQVEERKKLWPISNCTGAAVTSQSAVVATMFDLLYNKYNCTPFGCNADDGSATFIELPDRVVICYVTDSAAVGGRAAFSGPGGLHAAMCKGVVDECRESVHIHCHDTGRHVFILFTNAKEGSPPYQVQYSGLGKETSGWEASGIPVPRGPAHVIRPHSVEVLLGGDLHGSLTLLGSLAASGHVTSAAVAPISKENNRFTVPG